MRKVIFYPFIPAMVNIVEKWLQTKSRQGLILVRRSGWIFVFEEKQANDTRYFMYFNLDASIGFATEYYYVKQRYGKGKSKINKLNLMHIQKSLSKLKVICFSQR